MIRTTTDPITDDVLTEQICGACGEEGHDAPAAAPVHDHLRDDLIEAVTDLEVAVDEYTHGVFVNVTNPDPEDVPVSTLRAAVVAASTSVALAMADGDIDLVNATAAVSVIPVEIREQAADAEIAALHGAQKLVAESRCSRCAGTGQFITYVENGVPKGPGGICYRCNGKGFTTTADRRRNYGHDNFAPILM